MSLTKRLLELGWTPIGKAICCECVTNPALRAIVEENLAFDACDYCRKTGEEIAADTDVVMEHNGAHRGEHRERVDGSGQRASIRDRGGRLPG